MHLQWHIKLKISNDDDMDGKNKGWHWLTWKESQVSSDSVVGFVSSSCTSDSVNEMPISGKKYSLSG